MDQVKDMLAPAANLYRWFKFEVNLTYNFTRL